MKYEKYKLKKTTHSCNKRTSEGIIDGEEISYDFFSDLAIHVNMGDALKTTVSCPDTPKLDMTILWNWLLQMFRISLFMILHLQ